MAPRAANELAGVALTAGLPYPGLVHEDHAMNSRTEGGRVVPRAAHGAPLPRLWD